MNAIKPIAEISLWCVRGGRVIPFIASVSSPYEDENGEDWRCKVSLGDILEHHISSLRQVNSMLALVAAIQFIATFLKKDRRWGMSSILTLSFQRKSMMFQSYSGCLK